MLLKKNSYLTNYKNYTKNKMKNLIRFGGYLMLFFVALCIVVIGIFAQRDLPVAQLKLKYSNPTSRWMPLMGMNVHYKDQGNEKDSVPLIFIHGTSSSLHTWDTVISKLLKEEPRSKRLISLDMPGFGLTGPSPENMYNFSFFGSFLDSFLNTLAIKRCILVGNSLGGGIVWHYSLSYSEKVKKLILIDASGYPKKDEKGSIGFKIASMPVVNNLLLFITPKSLIKKSLENVFFDQTLVTDEIVSRYYDLLLREGNRKAALSLFKNQIPSEATAIKKIKVPTLIIWGEQDQLISVANAYQFKKDIQESELLILSNVGHIPMEESPQKVATAVSAFVKK